MDAADRAAAAARVAQQPRAGLVVGVGGPHRARSVANPAHVGSVIALVFQRNILRHDHSARVAFVGELCDPRRGEQPRELQQRIGWWQCSGSLELFDEFELGGH